MRSESSSSPRFRESHSTSVHFLDPERTIAWCKAAGLVAENPPSAGARGRLISSSCAAELRVNSDLMGEDVVIRAEGLGKKYVISHQAERQRYIALRDVLVRGAHN